MSTLEERLHELREKAHEYAEARAEQVYLEHFRQSKLAILMKRHALDGHKTIAAQDREARADPEYLEFLQGLKAATEKAEKARYNLEVVKLAAGLWQTQEANKRAEMRAYGLTGG